MDSQTPVRGAQGRGSTGRGTSGRSTAGRTIDAVATGVATFDAINHTSSAASNLHQARSIAGRVVAKGRAGQAAGRTLSKVANAAAKVADSRVGSALGKTVNTIAGSTAFKVASRASLPLLGVRAGMNAFTGFQNDGVRGAVRGALSTVDPTGLVNSIAGGDGRGVVERGFDAIFGQAARHVEPNVGAFLNAVAEARTKSHEAKAAAEQASSPRQAATPQQPGGGPVEVKAYTRADGTPVGGYSVSRKAPS